MASRQDFDGDVYIVDRDSSPDTIEDAPLSRPYSTSERDSLPDIIDLEAFEGFPNMDLNDFMTDAEFDAAFGAEANPDGLSGATLDCDLLTTQHRNIHSCSDSGKTYKRGKTVELLNGDFLRIVNVLENRRTKEKALQGFRLQRVSRWRGLLDQHLNELILVTERDNDTQGSQDTEMDIVSLEEVTRIREVVLTNTAFPSYSCREDISNTGKPRDFMREQCRLVCRWKMTTIFRPHATRGRVWLEKSIERLRADNADTAFKVNDEHLRRRWRGATMKGGSCEAWLPGEQDFDTNERNINQGIDILGFHSRLLGPQERRNVVSRRYILGDAFCGAGGASRGAKAAGFRVDFGFDFDLASIQSYSQNFYNARCEATPAHVFITYLNENYIIDVLHISPPCQTFSPAHTRIGKDDEENSASFFAIEELLKKTKPRIVTLENTFGLVERWKDWLKTMVRFFTALGFSIRWRIFNLAEYGLPQARRRLIVFAACPGETLLGYPQPTHGPGRLRLNTVNDAISTIPDGFPDHDAAGAPRRDSQAYDGNIPLKNCITTAGSLDIHPSGRRVFTERELACLQGFPLEHKFGNLKIKKQIGNAVPPLVAKTFFDHIRKWLEVVDGQGG